MITNFKLFEKLSDRKYGKDGFMNSKSIDKKMKEIILPYITSNSYYSNKIIHDLKIPSGKSFKGVSLSGDKDGFFVHTHRGRSDSYVNIDKIPSSVIKWVESTG